MALERASVESISKALSDIVHESSAVAIVEGLIADAYHLRASDIHLDPREHELSIRIRIDGRLISRPSLSRLAYQSLLSRIKVLAGLRTDEHQRPQDGRFRHDLPRDTRLDIRVSIVPTYFGESVVLRILGATQTEHSLEALGFTDGQRRLIERALAKPHGLILLTGPTGSGKSTTLYTLLRTFDALSRSIITIEDPIEYSIPNVRQIEVNERTGLSFATGLRSILRQDPDILMVGEIRDSETARLAVNAALTGHLVFSTLHTNDSVSAIPRLLDLSIEPYLLSPTLRLIIAQRLVRRLCDACKLEYVPDQEEIARYAVLPIQVTKTCFKPLGCASCDGTGYRGRIGIFELFSVEPDAHPLFIKELVLSDLRRLARSKGARTLLEDGLRKVTQGLTSLDEIYALAHE